MGPNGPKWVPSGPTAHVDVRALVAGSMVSVPRCQVGLRPGCAKLGNLTFLLAKSAAKSDLDDACWWFCGWNGARGWRVRRSGCEPAVSTGGVYFVPASVGGLWGRATRKEGLHAI